MLLKSYDAIVIGGGFAGAAIAYNLARRGCQTLLLEAKSLGSGTSGACAGRAQVIESHDEAYLDLVLAGFDCLQTLGEELGCDLEWETPGHLTLLHTEEQWREYEGYVKRLEARGAPAEMLGLEDLRSAEPCLCSDGFLGAARSLEGRLNPFRFCHGFAQAARRYGAEIRIQTPITGFERQAGRIVAVHTAAESFAAQIVVLAAGAWSGELAASAGVDLPVRFTHAESMVSERLPPLIHHHIGMPGFYEAVHGENRTVTLGVGQHRCGTLLVSNAIEKADTIDRNNTAWGIPALARAFLSRFPRLGGVNILRGWAAPSPFLPDYQPAIGWLPGCQNLFVAAGFHLAIPTIPLLSRQVAAAILGEPAPLLAPYAPARFFE